VGRGIFTQIRWLQAPSHLTLHFSREGVSTSALGDLRQLPSVTLQPCPSTQAWLLLCAS